MSASIVLAGSVRTPIGAFGGALADVSAPALGAAALKAALSRAGVPPEQVDDVIVGNVISAGLGQNVARQCAIGAGLPVSIGATSINKLCGSGLQAVALAANAITAGASAVVLAGGTESMSRAPYLLDKARTGYRLGHGELVDTVLRDGLWDVYNNVHMGTCGDRCAAKYGFTRAQQDDFAVMSYERALAAQSAGAFATEMVPVEVPNGKAKVTVQEDETPRKFNPEKLRQLRPAFGKDGTVTAGNASSINDGAAAVVVLAAEKAQTLGVRPEARILGCATAAREPEWFTLAPIGALQKLFAKTALKVADVDLFEINEAFSAVTMAAMKELAIPHEKVNVHGGAVALGHPIGASGTRTLVTLIHALRQRGGKVGVVTLCIGGGEAIAMAIELL